MAPHQARRRSLAPPCRALRAFLPLQIDTICPLRQRGGNKSSPAASDNPLKLRSVNATFCVQAPADAAFRSKHARFSRGFGINRSPCLPRRPCASRHGAPSRFGTSAEGERVITPPPSHFPVATPASALR